MYWDPDERKYEPVEEGPLVIYKRGVWQIISRNNHPMEDLRPQWGWENKEGGPFTTYTLSYRFGPKHPEGHTEVEVRWRDYYWPNEMEVLAVAASEDDSPSREDLRSGLQADRPSGVIRQAISKFFDLVKRSI